MAPARIPPIKVGHIDDVQELRKSKPSLIPERFVREMTDRPSPATVLPLSSSSIHIPVIDLSKLLWSSSSDEFQRELRKLAESCEDWGFFQVLMVYQIVYVSANKLCFSNLVEKTEIFSSSGSTKLETKSLPPVAL